VDNFVQEGLGDRINSLRCWINIIEVQMLKDMVILYGDMDVIFQGFVM